MKHSEQDRLHTNMATASYIINSSLQTVVVCVCVFFFLCRDGIEFVFQGYLQQSEKHSSPPYLSYLTILSEFSSKLLKPDKKTMWVNQQCRETARSIRDNMGFDSGSTALFSFESQHLQFYKIEHRLFSLFVSSDIAICNVTPVSRASVTGRSAGCLSSITERLSRAQLREKTPCPSSALTLINSTHSIIAPDRPPSNRLHLKVRQGSTESAVFLQALTHYFIMSWLISS